MIGITFDKEIDTLVLRITGSATADTYVEGTQLIIRSAHFHPGIAAIWDFREADIRSLTSDDAYAVVRFAESMTSVRGSEWLVAIVVTPGYAFGMARLLEQISEGAPYTMMAFCTMEDAREWIRTKK